MADGTLTFDTKIDNNGFESGIKNLSKLIERLDKTISDLSNAIRATFTGFDTASAEQSTENLSVSLDDAKNSAEHLEEALNSIDESNIEIDTPTELISSEAIENVETAKESIDNIKPALNEVEKEAENIDIPNIDTDMKEATVSANEFRNTLSFISQAAKNIPALFDHLKSRIRSTFTESASQETLSSNQIRLQNNIAKTEYEMQKLEKAMNKMRTEKIPTEEYQEIQKQISTAQNKLNGYLDTEERMKATGVSQDSAGWKNLQYKIEEARKTIMYAQGELQELESTGKAFTIGGDTEKLTDMQSKYNLLKGKLNEYKVKLTEVQAKEGQQSASSSRLSIAFSKLSSVVKGAANALLKTSKITGVVISSFGKMTGGIGKAAKTIISKMANIGNVFRRGQQSVKGYGNSIKGMLKSIVIYRLLSQAVSSLGNTMLNYLKTNNSFTSSLAQIKGNLLTAFQPIYSAIVPAINTLMQLLVQATGVIAQFTSALFGKSVKASQAAAKAQYKQAEALENTSKAASDAAEANKQLSDIDELHNVNDSGSSGGGGGGGGSGIAPDFDTNINTTDGVNEFVEKLKEAWRTADFTEIGAIVADKINGALASINWDKIQAMSQKIAKSIYTFINGFIGELDWKLVGDTIGNGINTALAFVDTLITGINWDVLGAGIGTALQSAINRINWAGIGNTLSNGLNSIATFINNFYKSVNWIGFGSNIATSLNTAISNTNWASVGQAIGNTLNMAIHTAYGFITTFDWSGLGQNIATGINNFLTTTDWTKLAKGASSLAIGLLKSVTEAIKGIDWRLVGNTIGDMISNINWGGIATGIIDLLVAAFNGLVSTIFGIGETIGKNIINGLKNGITLSDIIKNAASWIKKHIFNPIINNIKSLFGIHSPSTVMEGIGKNIMQGMINGIKSLVNSVKDKFKTLLSDIKGFFTGIPEWFGEKFSSALAKIKSAFSANNVKAHFNSIWSDIKGCFSNVADWFKNTFTKAWTNVKNVFSTGGKIYDGIKEGIGDTFKSVVNKLISGINVIIATPFKKINSMLNTIRNVSVLGVKPFSGLWGQDPLSIPKIPALATGTVVPRNYGEFLAILGDNKREAEVVSPLSTIEKAVENVLNRRGNTGNGIMELHLTFVRDGKKEYEQIMQINQEQAKAGKLSFAIS